MNARGLLSDWEKRGLKGLLGLGILCFAASLYLGPSRALADPLIGNFYFVSLSLAAACFIAIQYLSSAGWSVVLRRVPEAMTAYLPVGAAVTGVLILAGARLYPWAQPELVAADAALQSKAAYLNLPFFAVRAAIYFAAWSFLIRRLLANSRSQDETGGLEFTRRNRSVSAVYLLVFAFTFTLASIDWTMSLEPHWYSTIYPWFLFAGAFVYALAVMALLVVAVRRRGIVPQISEHHLHDLGKYLFAFSVFWAYLWFSQYLLIWYSNIPEETTFYVRRLAPGWIELFWLNPVVNFATPFFLLLKIRQKRSGRMLLLAGAALAAGHWLNLYLLVMPAVDGAHPLPGPLDIGIFLGFAAVFLLRFDRSLNSAAPVPLRDPLFEESLHHHA